MPPSYWLFGIITEWSVGRARIFENLNNVRQTRHAPLILSMRSRWRWTHEQWSPLDGRTFNAGLRWRL